jgi:hypothetical protein
MVKCNKIVETREINLNKSLVYGFGWDKQDRQYTYHCNTEACSCNHCCHLKALNITYSECVSVALGTQHAKCIRRIKLSSVACGLYLIFSTLSQTAQFWGEKKDISRDRTFVLIFATAIT